MMKRFVLYALCLIPFVAEAQVKKSDLNAYLVYCRTIVEKADKLEDLKSEIKSLQEKRDSIRSVWYNSCMKYLQAPGTKYTDELDYLIERTDSIFDGKELYTRLLKARQEASPRGAREDDPSSGDTSGVEESGYIDEDLMNLK